MFPDLSASLTDNLDTLKIVSLIIGTGIPVIAGIIRNWQTDRSLTHRDDHHEYQVNRLLRTIEDRDLRISKLMEEHRSLYRDIYRVIAENRTLRHDISELQKLDPTHVISEQTPNENEQSSPSNGDEREES